MSIFSERLLSLIRQTGITQAHFASALGITPQAASCYVKGREPSFNLLIKIADYFHVTTDYLLGMSENERVSIKNYGDVANVLLALFKQETLNISVDEPIKDCPQVTFSIPQYDCNTFFSDYLKMLRLYGDKSISGNVFGTWLGAELAKLQALPLPEICDWIDGKWIAKSDRTQDEEGSHGLDQETDH